MRLADLRVARKCKHGAITPCSSDDNQRPATVADLIAALKEEGAVVDTWDFGELQPGRYLVFRIDEEGEK